MKTYGFSTRALALFMLAFALAACSSSQGIRNPQIEIATTKALTQDEVRVAILTACTQTHWVPRDLNYESIEAVLRIRAHTAVINIEYTATDYHIKYKGSTNLQANKGKIHPYYNSWVESLRKKIDAELASIAATKQ